jgi:hypothetical protein
MSVATRHLLALGELDLHPLNEQTPLPPRHPLVRIHRGHLAVAAKHVERLALVEIPGERLITLV